MLFEKLVIARIRDTVQPVTISTGIAYGHKIMDIGKYRFIELADNIVVVESENFYAKCTTWEELEFIYKAMR
jgi:hypothetical protein